MAGQNDVMAQPAPILATAESAETSQTAKDYIDTQLQLEADAREALPYAFDTCTRPLGPLRQKLFACLTCNPPHSTSSADTKNSSEDGPTATAASVCYSCSIACHGEHTLVELFNRRNFTCDCGTTRLPAKSPCTLQINTVTGLKGDVKGEEPGKANTYNHNVWNRFCACGDWYDSDKERGTMYQCLGLSGEADGGCGEDWWHPECIVWGGEEGQKRRKERDEKAVRQSEETPGDDVAELLKVEEDPVSGFPGEDDFETFICYKCIRAAPWLKPYAGTDGFLPPVLRKDKLEARNNDGRSSHIQQVQIDSNMSNGHAPTSSNETSSLKKRTADDADLGDLSSNLDTAKRSKSTGPGSSIPAEATDQTIAAAYHTTLPPAPSTEFSLFCREDFRDHICRCKVCYPKLKPFPQLLDEEEAYEPPMSETDDEVVNATGSIGSKSLLERGEAALSNVDRVRAIEGVMVYNHLKDKVKSFLQPFAESGQAVGAEDIKAYFEKLRGDEQGISNAAEGAEESEGGDNRREQSGY